MEGLSEYEKRRWENIKQNEESMKECGLGDGMPWESTLRSVNVRKKRAVGPKKVSSGGTRKSARLSTGAPPAKKQALGSPPQLKAKVKVEKQVYVPRPIKTEYSPVCLKEDGIHVSCSFAPGVISTKDIDARIDQASGDWVGKIMIPPEGCNSMKATAMYALGTQKPRFSKYSGIQQFKNCIVLFVNASPFDNRATYNNMFIKQPNGKLVMSWFAQSRQKTDTPVIMQMQRPETKVFLMLRIPAQAYVCCGKLTMFDFDCKQQPLKFQWTLNETDILLESGAFGEIMKYSSGT
mmetsp:Transcript_30349/g.48330  ORF Transcript_30349/g.48330 Transcript_30349/m.48330 type:complete len:293 (+) Transcript_30349:4232-5110(+)